MHVLVSLLRDVLKEKSVEIHSFDTLISTGHQIGFIDNCLGLFGPFLLMFETSLVKIQWQSKCLAA